MFEIIFFALPAIISVYIYKSLTQNKYTNFDLLAIWSSFVLFINLVILSCASLHNKFAFPFISTQTTGIFVLKFLLISIFVAVTIPILLYYLKYKTEIVKECRGELNTITARPEWCLSQLAKAIGFIVLLSWIYMSLTMRFFGDDKIVFSKASVGIDFLISRYNTWSSRLAIESLLVPLSKNFNIFKLFNIFILCTLPIGFWLLFKRLNYAVWSFVLAVSLYNISEMSSSGWAATLSNYYYAAWACVFATYLQTKVKLSITAYIVLAILMIYACSAEQCAIAMVVISAGIFWKTRNKAALLSVFIAAISLFMFVNAPGNGVRLERAIQRFPDFVSYTVIYKAYLGYISTLSYYLFQENFFMIFFIGIIVLGKTSRPSLSLFVMLLFLILQHLGLQEFGGYFGKNYYPDKSFNFSSEAALAFIVSLLFVLLTTWLILKLEITGEQKVIILILLATGVAVRSVLGFSPTLWLSHLRTFCFTNFILLASTYYLALVMKIKEKDLLLLLIPCALLKLIITAMKYQF